MGKISNFKFARQNFIDELQMELAFKVHKKTNNYGSPILDKQ